VAREVFEVTGAGDTGTMRSVIGLPFTHACTW
jgi:bifunctional ADP-heptose synthase (sugar kinase/adenylyltransferase)